MSSTVGSGLKAYPPSVFWDTPGASTSKDVDVHVKHEHDYISPEPPSLSPSPSAIDPSGHSPSPGPSPAHLSADHSSHRDSRSPSVDELQDDSPPPPSIISSRALPPSVTRPYMPPMPPGGRPILINTSFEHNILPPLQPPKHAFQSESSPTLSSRSPSSRVAPYPSPILSRRDGLQSPSPKTPYDANAALVYGHASISNYSPLSPLPPIKEIKRDTVTTTATQAASANRRRNEAHFICPVPGCGSTFTRRFNLRGHMRSHLEERPFTCEWPGCGKSFARQHDCKRHTALHSVKPKNNSCKGCGKTFSRLDALNQRHRTQIHISFCCNREDDLGCVLVRSEGGAECRQAAGQQLPPLGATGLADALPLSPTSSFSQPSPISSPSTHRHGLYRVKTEPYADDELLTLAPIRSPTDLAPASASTEGSRMDISPTNSRSTAHTSPTEDVDVCMSPRSLDPDLDSD